MLLLSKEGKQVIKLKGSHTFSAMKVYMLCSIQSSKQTVSVYCFDSAEDPIIFYGQFMQEAQWVSATLKALFLSTARQMNSILFCSPPYRHLEPVSITFT